MSLKDQAAKEQRAAEMRARDRKSLPARARKFCLNVFRGMSDVEASLAAGFPELCAKQRAVDLRNDPRVMLLIKELEEKGRPDDGEELSREYVLKRLRRLADNCEIRGRDASPLRAWELIGKSLAMFTERNEIETDDNLAELIAAGRRRVLEGIAKPAVPEEDSVRPKPEVPPADSDPSKFN